MSRIEFRAAVATARPPTAWLMVTVAGATLWVTGRLALWAIGAQAGAILASLALRRRPHRWQQSPIALNVGMLAIVAGVIHVALGGEPATVGLAHFAALTQGLQLLDARPRRSEFLLVALALFQVILASNLTDSVWFPPLLVVYVLATTWTLLVHTLRAEAIEAGEPEAARAAIAPDLVRTTLLASTASLVLALGLFVVLPRMRSTVLAAPDLGPGVALAGFSERVELGTIGRIRQDPRVVLRVETLQGEVPPPPEAYWRGKAFDHFDGRLWSTTSNARALLPGSPELGLTLARDPERANLVQRIVREPVAGGVVFAAGRPLHVQGSLDHLERDTNGALYAAGQEEERVHYTVASASDGRTDAGLLGDRALPPGASGGRYLSLPGFGPEIAALAREITGAARTDVERVRAIEGYLISTGRYTDEPPLVPPDAERTPVEAFLLGERAGHCEYFASAMVVLARSLGIPARLVNGFAGGRRNPIGDFVELASADAHSWVEVHFDRAGWVRYDPTPPDLRLRAALAASLGERLAQFGSALELWWFRRVVSFDRTDQIRALRAVWARWQRTGGSSRESREAAGDARHADAQLLGSLRARDVALGVAALGLLIALAAHRRAGGATPLPPAYAEALRLLARRGLAPAPATTARSFAQRVEASLPAAGPPFRALTEAYLAERFGARPAPTAPHELAALRARLVS